MPPSAFGISPRSRGGRGERRDTLAIMRLLIGALVLLACLAAACGSGDETARDTATATSQRAERQATVTQQHQQPQQQQTQQVAQQEAQQQAQQEAQQTVELPTDDVGVHKGLRSERNVLGEPDAPVLIEYYGDFT